MLQRLKALIRNYFGFSQKETNGFLAMLLLMTLLLFAPSIYRYFLPVYDPVPDRELLDEIVAQLELEEETGPGFAAKHSPVITGITPSAPFNPNDISAEEWQKMGLPAKIAQRIKNYQAKGGTFKVKEDVGKIYGFPEDLYQRLYPLLNLPDRETFLAERNAARFPDRKSGGSNFNSENRPSYASNRKAPLQLFDINKADTTQLKRIRSIGSKRAQWILSRREKLGGFYSMGQISEIFGLDSAAVDSVRKYTFVAPDYSPKKIFINTTTVDALGKHPYFNFKMAKAVIAYREQHGAFQKPEDLLKVKLVTPDALRKIRPYLEF